MDDALSAASLLLAALALVYSAWTPSIEATIARPSGTTDDEKVRGKKEARSVRNRRAMPIAIGSFLVLAVFIPRDVGILFGAVRCTDQPGCTYDDVAVVFLLTQLLLLGMVVHSLHQVGRLNGKL